MVIRLTSSLKLIAVILTLILLCIPTWSTGYAETPIWVAAPQLMVGVASGFIFTAPMFYLSKHFLSNHDNTERLSVVLLASAYALGSSVAVYGTGQLANGDGSFSDVFGLGALTTFTGTVWMAWANETGVLSNRRSYAIAAGVTASVACIVETVVYHLTDHDKSDRSDGEGREVEAKLISLSF